MTLKYADSTMYYREVNVMAFSIRLTEDEKKLAESYARLNAMSVGEAFKKALFEKIEDEYDLALGERAYREWIESGKESQTLEEFEKELDL